MMLENIILTIVEFAITIFFVMVGLTILATIDSGLVVIVAGILLTFTIRRRLHGKKHWKLTVFELTHVVKKYKTSKRNMLVLECDIHYKKHGVSQ